MPIEDLIEKMRADDAPAEESPSPLRKLIAATRKAVPDRDGFEIAVEDVVATIEFVELTGPAWSDLTAVNPPRKGSSHDWTIGYNSTAVVRAYPVESVWRDGETKSTILVDGAPVAAEQWAEFADLLDVPALEDAATVLWAIHVGKPRQRRAQLLAEKEAKNG